MTCPYCGEESSSGSYCSECSCNFDDCEKEKYTLVGINGNAYSVMGYVARSMKSEGKTKDQIDQYRADATSGDYNHLLSVSQYMIEELNRNAS